jgi:hypothetical protein
VALHDASAQRQPHARAVARRARPALEQLEQLVGLEGIDPVAVVLDPDADALVTRE